MKIVHGVSGPQFSHRSGGRNVEERERATRVRLTHAAVVDGGIVDPALRLLDLSFQVHSCLRRPAVRHGFVGLGLQVLQSRGDLFGQSSGLGSVTFTPIRKQKKEFLSADMADIRSVKWLATARERLAINHFNCECFMLPVKPKSGGVHHKKRC